MYSGQFIVLSSQTLEQKLPYEERFSPTTAVVRNSKLSQNLFEVIKLYCG